MAKYRYVSTNFWQDKFILDISFEEKGFYLYLLTNPRTTQCGIYNFSVGMSSVELSLTKEKIQELIKKFVDYGKVLYDETTGEIMIINWYKYGITKSKQVHQCINKELKTIKNKDFVMKLYELCKASNYDLEELFKDIAYIEDLKEE